MSDSYPASFVIEIDRERLTKYFRVRSLLLWGIVLSFLGGLLGGPAFLPERGARLPFREAVLNLVRSFAEGVGLGLVLALLIYAIFCHRRAARRAAYLEVTVEGPFLRVRQQTHKLNNATASPTVYRISSDRKLHFRSIIDYTVTQDFLMRYCEIYALEMTTPAAGLASFLVIPGVKDCLKVRDMLSEIDRVRENQ
jgi:hypothetical protein